MTPKVFISSTSRDLDAYRRAAGEECIRLQLLPIMMEFFEAMAKGATAGSQRKLDDADLYVGFFGHRYGYIEDGQAVSVTESEFDYAVERGLDRLCFLVEPDYEIGRSDEDQSYHTRLETFKRKVEKSVIRDRFTTVDDFRGKLRLALQEWKAGDAKARLPQPPLAANVLAAHAANRLTYRARVTPFVGREAERAILERFLAAPAPLAWTVVSGPGGAGKSRLVQELCLALAPAWRAGFLPLGPGFDWIRWQPNADTLIAIDYAAERVDEIRAMLSTLAVRGELSARVRVLLVEREAEGEWMQRLTGGRSDGYAIAQARFEECPLVVGGLAPEALWAVIRGVLRSAVHSLPPKAALLERLREIDPGGRPLFAAFAADALASGRNPGAWDRDRLLHDLLARERERWNAAGVPAGYENLLALATAVGGDTERILDVDTGKLALPAYRDFNRQHYSVMSGCELDDDEIPTLKPDLLGEFFVLEHVKGRNDRVTALQAAELMDAAWRIRGGSKADKPFGVPGLTCLSPSSLILFLTRMAEDFPDHPSTRSLLRRPEVDGADLRYWAILVALGIRRQAMRGDTAAAKSLFDEFSAMTPDALRAIDGIGGFFRAGLYLLPVLVKEGKEPLAREVLRHVRGLLGEHGRDTGPVRDFCDAAHESVVLLLEQGSRTFVDELIEAQAALVHADTENQDLRLPYCRALAAMVRAPGDLVQRERANVALLALLKAFEDDGMLYEPVAAAAQALCEEYAKAADRLSDAESQNRLIRSLERRRSAQHLYRSKGAFSFDVELVVEDLRQIRRHLLASDAELVAPWTLAERFADASMLVDEAKKLWRRFHEHDIEFARGWGWIVVRHADARAQQGAAEQVPKAVEALLDAAAEFDGDPWFARVAAELCRVASGRAASCGEMSTAEELLRLLRNLAERDSAVAEIVATYAQAAMTVCLAYEDREEWDARRSVARIAESAIRSEAYLARLRALGTDQAGLDEIVRWIDAMMAGNTSGG